MTNSVATAPPNAVSQLIQLLAQDQHLTSIEIAETLWLALQMEPVPPPEPAAVAAAPPSSMAPAMPPAAGSSVSSAPPVELSPPAPAPKANIAMPLPQAGVLPSQVLPVWLADPAMLTDSLAIMRALKPLLQQVVAGTGDRLDEAATVDAIARTRLCVPILQPNQEPWFDVVLVVDRGSSMHIWQRLVQDIVRLLRRYGAFRDVQVFDLVIQSTNSESNNSVQLISNPQRPGHSPSELIDQRGRRLVILLSDCAASYWWDGTLLPLLQCWGQVMPTVLWHMLPAWMWNRTALGRGTAIALRSDRPGVANQQLQVHIQTRHRPADADQRLAIPVVTSEVANLARWSLMVAGDRRQVMPGFLLPPTGGIVPRSQSVEELARDRAQQRLEQAPDQDPDAALQQALTAIAQERVQRFLTLASPSAQRLVMLLAAAPVITPPVVRLIRDAMLSGESSPLPVAEVFLSGLLQRLLEADSPELVQYDFIPNARQILLDVLPAVDTIQVINHISAAVERRWNQFSQQDFRAFLTNPTVTAPAGLEGVRSFASITAEILEQLGGDYAQFAQQLRVGSGEIPPDEPDGQPEEFPLEDLEYEVAKLVNFPPLQTCEYESATITAILERFDFETATIERETGSSTTLGDRLLERATPRNNQASRLIVLWADNHPNKHINQRQGLEMWGINFVLATSTGEALRQISRQKFDAIVYNIVRRSDARASYTLLDRLRASGDQTPFIIYAGSEKSKHVAESRRHGAIGCTDDPNELFEMLLSTLGLGRGWEIKRRRAVAWGYTEILDSDTDTEVGLAMIAIPGGRFTMGASKNESNSEEDERPQHGVTLPPFYLGRYPVTQVQWRVVAGYERINRELDPDPSDFKGDNHPVENVSWDDVQEFCQRFSVKTGKEYRLPSEAEWEYACRTGTKTPFHFGETITTELVNYDGNYTYKNSPQGEYREKTTAVGSFPANEWGLHDMHGNVWEWCEDAWHASYEGSPNDGSAWVDLAFAETRRVLRGGSWDYAPQYCRSAVRASVSREYHFNTFGFRVCCGSPIS